MRILLQKSLRYTLLVAVISTFLGTMSSCAQPRVFLGGGFPGRPVPPVYYAPPGAFAPRGQVVVPPQVVIVPRQRFAPRPWGWGGGRAGFGGRAARRGGC